MCVYESEPKAFAENRTAALRSRTAHDTANCTEPGRAYLK